MLWCFFVGFSTSIIPVFQIEDYGIKLITTTVITALTWLTVLFVTPPEEEAVLKRFVVKVRPPGPGWHMLRQKFGISPCASMGFLVMRFLLSSTFLFSVLLGSGSFLIHNSRGGWIGISIGVACVFGLRRMPMRRVPLSQ